MKAFILAGALVFPFITFAADEGPITRDAQIWDRRQELITSTSKDLSKVLRKNGRVVQKGLESNRVNNLVAQTIQTANRRLKSQGLYVLQSSPGKPEEKRFALTSLDIERLLDAQDPVQREFAEESLRVKKETGRFLHGRVYSIESVPETFDNKVIFDLEKFEPIGLRAFDSLVEDFIKRTGKKSYALLLPKVELSDGSYSASTHFTVEQMANGSLQIFQERRKNRKADALSIQVLSHAPRTLVIVSKAEFDKALKGDDAIKSVVITSLAEDS